MTSAKAPPTDTPPATTPTSLVILTAYSPVDTTEAESNNVYQQQYRIIRNQGHDVPKPHKPILQDLSKLVKDWHRNHTEVIIMWDTNEPITFPQQDLAHFMADTNLILTTGAPGDQLRTYARGTRCIDYIMSSTSLHHSIVIFGIIPFYVGSTAQIIGEFSSIFDSSIIFGEAKPERSISSTPH